MPLRTAKLFIKIYRERERKMKRRIISSILVVVMLVLSLVSCGYSYTKDDLSQYVVFDKATFDKELEALDYEDGDFTTDPATRDKKVAKYIYDLLVKRIDSEEKLTEGKLSNLDKLYYRYYVTYKNKDGKDVVFYASKMQKSNSTTYIQLGDNTLTNDKAEIRDVINELVEAGKLDAMENFIYEPDNSSSKTTTTKGAKAYISYIKTWTEDVNGTNKDYKETYTYEEVILGETNFAAKKLVESTVGSTLKTKDKDGKDVDATFEHEEGGVKYTYSALKVNWIVPTLKDKDGKDTGKVAEEITVDYQTTSKITLSDSDLVMVNTKWTESEKKAITEIPAKTTITYHICPAYFQSVDALDADIVLKELLAKLPKTTPEEGTDEVAEARELASLKDAGDELEDLDEKLADLSEKETAYDEAVEARESAEKALKNIDKDKDSEGYKKAEGEVKAKIKEEESAKKEVTKAETDVAKSLEAVYKKVNSEDTDAAKKTIVEEYEKAVRDVLTEEYNKKVKNNVVKAIWKLLSEDTSKKFITVSDHPRDAVRETYDRMFEMHEAIFYGKSDTETNKSFYSIYNGEFEKYLIETMKTESNWSDAKDRITDYKSAKDALWALAKEHVEDIMIIYVVSKAYGVLYNEDEIDDFKNADDRVFEYYEAYYGENNVLAAHQFDALIDYFVEVDKDDDGKTVYDKETGAPVYSHITLKDKNSK